MRHILADAINRCPSARRSSSPSTTTRVSRSPRSARCSASPRAGCARSTPRPCSSCGRGSRPSTASRLIPSPPRTARHSLPLRTTFAMGEARAQSGCSSLSCSSRYSPRRRRSRQRPTRLDLDYQPPVDAPIVDRSVRRPRSGRPATGASTTTPRPARRCAAAEEGRVEFAGQVGGTLHVVVRHPDGLRTSYSFLASIAVVEGQTGLAAAAIVGTAGDVAPLRRAIGRRLHRPRARASRRRVQRAPRPRRRPDRGAASARRDDPRRGRRRAADAGSATAAFTSVGGCRGCDPPPIRPRSSGSRCTTPRRRRCQPISPGSVPPRGVGIGRKRSCTAARRREHRCCSSRPAATS